MIEVQRVKRAFISLSTRLPTPFAFRPACNSLCNYCCFVSSERKSAKEKEQSRCTFLFCLIPEDEASELIATSSTAESPAAAADLRSETAALSLPSKSSVLSFLLACHSIPSLSLSLLFASQFFQPLFFASRSFSDRKYVSFISSHHLFTA